MLRQSNRGERVDLIIGNLLFQQNITGNQSDHLNFNTIRGLPIVCIYDEDLADQNYLEKIYIAKVTS